MASNSKTGAIAALRRKLTDGSLITAVAEKGKEIAEEKYSLADYGTNQTNIVVSAEVISPAKARVTAKGDRISYLATMHKAHILPISFHLGGNITIRHSIRKQKLIMVRKYTVGIIVYMDFA